MRNVRIAILILVLATMPLPAKEVTITILATTDTHGNVSGFDYAAGKDLGYGLAQAATQINTMRKERKNLILVDLGDALSGNALPYYHHNFASGQPNPVIAAMNVMGYDVAVPGNHDFDFGTKNLVDAITESRFAWTSANLLQADSRTPLIYDTVVVDRDGVQVGFFGLTTPITARTQPPANIAGLEFSDMIEAARAAVEKLKEQGADVIVALAHSGTGSKLQTEKNPENAVYQVVEQVQGITAVLLGHSHDEISFELYNNVLLCQPKDHAQSIGVIIVDLQQRDGTWEILAKTSTTLKVDGLKPDKKVIRAAKDTLKACEDFANETLGTYDQELVVTGDPLVPGSAFFLLSDAVRAWKKTDVVTLPLQTPEEIIKSERADFRNRHMLKLTPYDNFMVQFEVTGRQLHDMLELNVARLGADGKLKTGTPGYYFDYFGGVQYKVNPLNPEGDRVEILTVNQKPFDINGAYSVAMTAYQYGMDRFFTGAQPEAIQWSERGLRTLIRAHILEMQESNE